VLKLQAKQVHSLAKEAVAKTEAALQIAEKDFEKALEEGMDTSEVYQVVKKAEDDAMIAVEKADNAKAEFENAAKTVLRLNGKRNLEVKKKKKKSLKKAEAEGVLMDDKDSEVDVSQNFAPNLYQS